jgi:hypothetical protein
VKYMMLIWSNEANWDDEPAPQDAEYAEYAALDQALLRSGELVISAGLSDPGRARTVRVRDGVAAATDGPFPEAKEYLAGFFLVECDSPERAEAVAASIPAARRDRIEVRTLTDVAAPHG